MCQESPESNEKKNICVSYKRLAIALSVASSVLTAGHVFKRGKLLSRKRAATNVDTGRDLSTTSRILRGFSFPHDYDIATVVQKTELIEVAEKDDLPFSLENLNLKPQSRCGTFKCMFFSTDPKIGWLFSFDEFYDLMVHQWEMSKYLEASYGIETLLLSPPERLTISAEMAVTLVLKGGSNRRFRDRVKEPHELQVVTQKTRVATAGFLLFGCICDGPKMRQMKEHWPDFIASIHEDTFLPRFGEGLVMMKTLVDKEPRFGHDFQVMIERDGTLNAIDVMDVRAGFEPNEDLTTYDEIRNTCFSAFKEIEIMVNEHFNTANNWLGIDDSFSRC